jgi:hypothetical protein
VLLSAFFRAFHAPLAFMFIWKYSSVRDINAIVTALNIDKDYFLNYSSYRRVLQMKIMVSLLRNRGSSVSLVTRLRTGRPGFDSWQG